MPRIHKGTCEAIEVLRGLAQDSDQRTRPCKHAARLKKKRLTLKMLTGALHRIGRFRKCLHLPDSKRSGFLGHAETQIKGSRKDPEDDGAR